MPVIEIAPSILSADLTRLAEQVNHLLDIKGGREPRLGAPLRDLQSLFLAGQIVAGNGETAIECT